MNVWNGMDRYPTDVGPVCATIGNYDGVHRGHSAILAEVVARARRERAAAVLVTFDPHPLTIVAPERRPSILQTRDQKLRALEDAGLDGVLFVRFTAELARRTGREFLETVLASGLELRSVHVGGNFRFGRDRAGNVELLRTVGEARGFDVVEVEAIEVDGTVVSSSAIRARIADGDVDGAARMLGRTYSIVGEVVRGDGRGRTLDYPTANVASHNELIPGRGVYVTETLWTAARYPSVTNVGVRPTFDGERLAIETHLLEFDDDLYHSQVEVRFLARLRDELRFGGPAELSDQIGRDLAATVAYFENGALGV
jgi:riboflavin kinase/FMN adenylyltransferase